MSIKKKILTISLILCMIFPSHVHGDEYTKLQKRYNYVSMKIASIRCSVHKDRRYVKQLKKDIKRFSGTKFRALFTKRLKNTKERIKKNRKKSKRYLQRLKKIRKKLKSIKTFNGVVLRYSKRYNITTTVLTKSMGVLRYNGHRETYYSQRVLPGGGLSIPGRHVANDGTVRDKDGYIVVAANPSFYSRGTRLMISLGPAKVYDCGCSYGTIDVYTNW
jgi:septal ring factor EnvC (AmiA/AmiB activator)